MDHISVKATGTVNSHHSGSTEQIISKVPYAGMPWDTKDTDLDYGVELIAS
jgi:hypothetical protein